VLVGQDGQSWIRRMTTCTTSKVRAPVRLRALFGKKISLSLSRYSIFTELRSPMFWKFPHSDLNNFDNTLTQLVKNDRTHVYNFQERHFFRTQLKLRGAPLPRKGLVRLKTSQCKHIQVTLDICLITISKNDRLAPGEPMVTLFG
jgi:hypothetical protein